MPMNNIVEIVWDISDYCKSECSYCPTRLRGGERPRETAEYIALIDKLKLNYSSINRKISWKISGGEPLDMDNIVPILRSCKDADNRVELTTNGGKLWMDWWAIEPYVDHLNLSYHYWQNHSLIEFLIDLFRKKGKPIVVSVPMRPDYFDYDLSRALQLEIKFNMVVSKHALLVEANASAGLFPYTQEQIDIMEGKVQLHKLKSDFENLTWTERREESFNLNPSYNGKMCNAGIEFLYISGTGWSLGSYCKNKSLDNAFAIDWQPPNQPQVCKRIACIFPSDQKITKFDP